MKEYKCDFCGKSGMTKDELYAHLKAMHPRTDKKPEQKTDQKTEQKTNPQVERMLNAFLNAAEVYAQLKAKVKDVELLKQFDLNATAMTFYIQSSRDKL